MLPDVGLTLPLEISIYLFLVLTMFSMGLALTTRRIVEPLRERRLVGTAFLINLLLIPIAAILIVRLLPMDAAVAAGILIVACAPGSTIGPKLAEFAKGNISLAISIMFFLSVLAIFTTPATLTIILPGAIVEQVDFVDVMTTLTIFIMVPMMAGLAINTWAEPFADRIRRGAFLLSNLSIVLVGIIFITVQITGEVRFYDMFLKVGLTALLAVLLIVAVSMLLGYFLAGPDRENRQVLATSSANRNLGVSLLVGASALAAHGEAFIIIIVYAIVQTIVSGLIAVKWGRIEKKRRRREAAGEEAGGDGE
jgi:BASS family bile acid:Na+ symporter